MVARTLAVSAAGDDMTALVAAVALAARAGTAVAVDADPLAGIPFPGRRSLADLVEESPTLDDLVPRRPGVAVLPNGGVSAGDASAIIDALRRGWPAVVARVSEPIEAFPHAPVCLALPGRGG